MNSSSSAVILLAAGGSSRIGLPKQLLQLHGKSLLRRAVETALSAQPAEVVAVLGFESDRMKHELDDLPVHLVLNSHWHEGVASSIRQGLAALPASIEAAVMMLCDQPLIDSSHIKALIAACGKEKPISATAYENIVGVPACYARSVFPELLELRGDAGAKKVIQRDLSRVHTISFPEAGIDIDTLKDFQSFLDSTPPQET